MRPDSFISRSRGPVRICAGSILRVLRNTLDRGCRLGFETACRNLRILTSGGALTSAPPTIRDYPVNLRGSKGEVRERTPSELLTLACREGWPDTCEHTGP